MALSLGIDLGTTNSSVGFFEGGQVHLVPNGRGKTLTPSVIGLDSRGTLIAGEAARNQIVSAPGRTLQQVKRSMGERVTLPLGEQRISPEEAGAALLRSLRDDYARYSGEEAPLQGVITVPAHFDDRQRLATVEAGLLAGFREVRLLNEPTAAALPYASRDIPREKIVVFDFGGGTLDITCLEREGREFSVIATVGDGELGGIDIDRIVFDRLAREVQAQTGFDPLRDRSFAHMLEGMAERAKIELSELSQTTVSIPFMTGPAGLVHVALELTRQELEELTAPVIDRALAMLDRAVKDASFDTQGFDTLVFSGGSSRLPVIRRKIADRYPEVAAASRINPDEVVAVGAALQADSRSSGAFTLHDVVTGTLALELSDGSCVPIVRKNQTIPTRRTRLFTTVSDWQEQAEIHLLQGDRPEACHNRSLGKFILSGLSAAQQGEPRIAVTVDVNADGVVSVRADDQQSGSSREMVAWTRPQGRKDPVQGDPGAWRESLLRRARRLYDAAPAGLAAELAEVVSLVQGAPGDPDASGEELLREGLRALETLVFEIVARTMARGEAGGVHADR